MPPLDLYLWRQVEGFSLPTNNLKGVESSRGACYVYRLLGRERLHPSGCQTSNKQHLDKRTLLWFCQRTAGNTASPDPVLVNHAVVIDLPDNSQGDMWDGRVISVLLNYISLVFLPWGKADNTNCSSSLGVISCGLQRICLQAPTYLYVTEASSTGLPILSEIFYQHGGEDAHPSIELPLPEAVVCLSVAAQQADHRSLRKGEFLVRLALVVVERTDKDHCVDIYGRQREIRYTLGIIILE